MGSKVEKSVKGKVEKSVKGPRSKPKRVAKVSCCISEQQFIADPWIGLRYERAVDSTAVHIIQVFIHQLLCAPCYYPVNL